MDMKNALLAPALHDGPDWCSPNVSLAEVDELLEEPKLREAIFAHLLGVDSADDLSASLNSMLERNRELKREECA